MKENKGTTYITILTSSDNIIRRSVKYTQNYDKKYMTDHTIKFIKSKQEYKKI